MQSHCIEKGFMPLILPMQGKLYKMEHITYARTLQFVWSTNQNQMLMICTSLPLESISLFFSLSSDSSSDCMCICKSSEDWSFATFCCSLFNINCQGEITPNESYLPEQVLHCCTVMLIFKKWQICDCVQFMFWM